MISRRSTFFLGIFIILIPFLGLPTSWKTTLVILSGVFLVSLSVKILLPKKSVKTRIRKEKVTPVFIESVPVSPANNTIEKISSKKSKTIGPDIR